MTLVKHYPEEPGWPGMKIWRYWCNCQTPTHVLELSELGEEMEFSLHVLPHNNTWSHRLKMIWKLLRGQDVMITEVFLDKKDRLELAKVIAGECKCTETSKESCCHQHPS